MVGFRMRSGRIVVHMERRDRPAQEKVQGPRKDRCSGNRGEPGRARIAAADADGSATILEAATGEEVHSFGWPRLGAKKSLAYSPDGRLLAGTGEDGTQIDIWDTQNASLDRPG